MSEIGATLGASRPGDPARTDQAGRPGGTPSAQARNLLRLSGLVITQGRTSLDLDIDGQRWTGRSERPLPDVGGRGARVVLEMLPDDGPAEERPARLLRTQGGRLRTPVDLKLRATPLPADLPAARPRHARPLEVTVRVVGQRGAVLPARLSLVAGAPSNPATPRPSTSEGRPTAAAGVGRVPGAVGTPARQPGPTGSAPLIVEGEVSGSDAANRLLLRVGARLLQVQEPLHLPQGARIRLTVAPADAAELDAKTGAPSRAIPLQPQPPRPLPADATLAARLADLAGHLASDRPGGSASERSAPSASARQQVIQIKDQVGSFRAIDLLFGIEPDLAELRLHLRDDRESDYDDPADRQADGLERRPGRAIVTVDFARLGPCQLDILCHGRRFDLRLRSEHPLPEAVRLEALALFVAARDAAGLEGELEFAPGELLAFEPTVPGGPGLDA